MIDVKTKLGYSVVDYTKDNENYLLISLTGEKLQTQIERPPISIVALLDVSSSMSPEYKIGYLKKSVVKLIENLSAKDRLSLVSYSTNARVLSSLTKMDAEGKKAAINIVNRLSIESMTNISEAITLGFNEFKGNLLTENVNRVILFTDGCPTAGNCNQDFLIKLSSNVPDGVQLTCMGYGKPNEPNGISAFNGMGGELNVTLLEQMSEKGKGNYYYMADPDSCGKAFANELAGLLTVVGQSIKVTVTPKAGHMSIVEVMDDYDVEDANGSAVITIPDIISEETKYILVKVTTPKVAKAWARPASIATVSVEYNNVIEGKVDVREASAKITFGSKSFTKEMDKEVKTQLEVLNAIKAQEQAFTFAMNGDYTAAINLMDNSINALRDLGTERGNNIAMGLDLTKTMCSNSASFTSSSNMRSAGLKAMKLGRSTGSVYDSVYCTSAQVDMQNSFVDGQSDSVPDTQITTSGSHPTVTTTINITKSYSKKSNTKRW